MTIWEAILFGIIEGVTEFLPVSSTGHLTIAERLMGFRIDDHAITAFTAIIQFGAVIATLVYFRSDIARIVMAWVRGVLDKTQRARQDYRLGWAIILGSLPIAVIGLLFKDQIETTLRSLWFVGAALLIWSAVMWIADRLDRQKRHEKDITWKDTLVIGAAQCIALIPGVSRSGATMSVGLLRGLDRIAVTRLSFFLAIPALTAAGLMQSLSEYKNISTGVGWGPTIVATLVSFVVAYASIAWLLRYVAKHSFTLFIVYRVIVGVVLLGLLASGQLAAV